MFLQPAYQEDLLLNNVTQERRWNETCGLQCTDTLRPKTYDVISLEGQKLLSKEYDPHSLPHMPGLQKVVKASLPFPWAIFLLHCNPS